MREEMQEATPPQETTKDAPPVTSENRKSVVRTISLIGAIVAILVIVVAAIFGMVTHPLLTSVIRDIAIIVLALVTILTCLFLAILILQLQSLIVLLREEIYPILESVNQTANTVRGTTTFVSDAVVTPMITAASYASAVRQTLKVLTGSPNRRRRSDPGPEQE